MSKRRTISAVRLHDEIEKRAAQEEELDLDTTTLAEFMRVLVFQSFDEQRAAAERKGQADG